MAYLRPLLGKKITFKLSMKILHLFYTVHRLLSTAYYVKKEPILASYPFLSLLRTYETGLSYVRGKPRNG